MTMDFRTRTADVRREAADILWRFRSSRVARRSGGAVEASAGAVTVVPNRPSLPVSPDTAELIREARATSPDGSAAQDTAAAAGPPQSDAAAIAPDGQDAGADCATGPSRADLHPGPGPMPARAPDAWGEGAADAPSEPAASAPPDGVIAVAQDPVAPESPPRRDLPPGATDLTDLPGVGAGLVWLLGRRGIQSLADLARADAAKLEQDLGPVGQLLDLPSWIALARQNLDSQRHDRTDRETGA